MQPRSCQRADEAGAPVNISGLTGKSGKCLVGWSWGDWETDDERSLLLALLPASGCEPFLYAVLKKETWLAATVEEDVPAHQGLLGFWAGPIFLPLPSYNMTDCALLHWIRTAQSQPLMAPSPRSLYLVLGSLNAWLICTTTHCLSPTPAADLDLFFLYPQNVLILSDFPRMLWESPITLLLTAYWGRFPGPCFKLCFFSPSGTLMYEESGDNQL